MRLLITSIARNIGYNSSRFILKIRDIQKTLEKHEVVYKWFIYENNSIDNTKKILQLLDKKIFIIVSENVEENVYIKEGVSLQRVERLARARNICLDYIREKSNEFDFVLVIDPDLYLIDINCIFETIPFEWDVLTANGKVSLIDNRYYDLYALRLVDEEKYQQEQQYDMAITKHPNLTKPNLDNKPIRVWSAFGGTALYKMQSIIKCEMGYYPYDGWCEHVGLHHQIINNGGKIFIYPKLITLWC